MKSSESGEGPVMVMTAMPNSVMGMGWSLSLWFV